MPHLVWEGVLLFLLVIVVALAAWRTPLFDAPALWWNVGTLGLLASALALSLRMATPNLAVAGLATLSAAGYAWLVVEASMPGPAAAAVVLVAMLILGGVLGLIAGLSSVPAWALTLAVLLLSQGITLAIIGTPQGVPTEAVVNSAGFWAAVFIVGSIAGGVVFAVPGVRTKLAGRLVADRTADPVRFVPRRLLTALLGLGGSTLLAALAGLASVSHLRFVVADFGSFNLFLALAAVLIGGVSVFGGKGGVAGTVLGTALVATVLTWLALEAVSEPWVRPLVVAVLVLFGLGISRGLEALTGRGRSSAPAAPPAPPPGPPPPNYPPQWGPAPASYR